MHPRQATQTLAGRVAGAVLVLAAVYCVLGALNACQAPLPVSPEMRCRFEPGCADTEYPGVTIRDSGTE